MFQSTFLNCNADPHLQKIDEFKQGRTVIRGYWGHVWEDGRPECTNANDAAGCHLYGRTSVEKFHSSLGMDFLDTLRCIKDSLNENSVLWIAMRIFLIAIILHCQMLYNAILSTPPLFSLKIKISASEGTHQSHSYVREQLELLSWFSNFLYLSACGVVGYIHVDVSWICVDLDCLLQRFLMCVGWNDSSAGLLFDIDFR